MEYSGRMECENPTDRDGVSYLEDGMGIVGIGSVTLVK
jgi:hypothetical protein